MPASHLETEPQAIQVVIDTRPPSDSEKSQHDEDTHGRLQQLGLASGDQQDGTPAQWMYEQTPYSLYSRYSHRRKTLFVAIVSWNGLISQVSSTSVLSALPEIADEYGTEGRVIALSNALYLVFMGISVAFWGPLSQVYGRRWTGVVAVLLTLACSIGTALSPTIASFFAFRILTALFGTAPIVLGPSVISDIYHPTSRGTAVGWLMSGTLIGPSVGPLIGGVIVTFRSWRVIFWLQTALAAVGGLAMLFFLPETSQNMRYEEMRELPLGKRVTRLWSHLNPIKVIWLVIRYPNLALAAYASGSIMFNMFGMLTPIRYVLNPRFALTSPAESGLFYLAPGIGYLTGTFFGGRWADRVVRRWIERRHGNRVPEDRLRSCLLALGVTLPGSMLVYGWTVDRAVGGIAVPVIAMFLGGVSQLFCFPSLNTYCLDVISGRGSEVMAGHLMVRYFFGAGASALVLPAVKSIGVGWFSTIAAGQMVLGAVALLFVTMHGREWRVKFMAREGAC